jgi:hypothetical protein
VRERGLDDLLIACGNRCLIARRACLKLDGVQARFAIQHANDQCVAWLGVQRFEPFPEFRRSASAPARLVKMVEREACGRAIRQFQADWLAVTVFSTGKKSGIERIAQLSGVFNRLAPAIRF